MCIRDRRKANQSHDVHIPIACPTAIRLLLRQLRLLRAVGRRAGPLFPSRKGAGRSKHNHVSTQSVRDALRKALHQVCGLSREQAALYSGHSLRVGGANHIRRLGLDDELLRMMGGWASLSSARGYFQLTAKEQFNLARQWTLKEREPPGSEGARVATISAVTRMSVSS